jgi:hypothetical protein
MFLRHENWLEVMNVSMAVALQLGIRRNQSELMDASGRDDQFVGWIPIRELRKVHRIDYNWRRYRQNFDRVIVGRE